MPRRSNFFRILRGFHPHFARILCSLRGDFQCTARIFPRIPREKGRKNAFQSEKTGKKGGKIGGKMPLCRQARACSPSSMANKSEDGNIAETLPKYRR
jgi:hypothetical protein